MKRALSLLMVMLLALTAATSLSAIAEEPIVMNYGLPMSVDRQASGEIFEEFRQYILDNTGVEVVVNYYDWGDTYNQKMNMYAAGMDLPSGVWYFSEPVKNSFTLSF